MTENLTLDVCPVENGVGGILQTLQGKMEILEIVEVVLDRLANDLGTSAVEAARGGIELLEECIGYPRGNLAHLADRRGSERAW